MTAPVGDDASAGARQPIDHGVDEYDGDYLGSGRPVRGKRIGPPPPVRWRRVALVVAGLLVGYYFVTLWQVWRTGSGDSPERADAIVVLGAAQYDGRPSPQLAARLDHALVLWEREVAPVVMVTGGNQPGDRFTEAQAAFDYLVERGVDPSAIMREDLGRTTYESLAAAAPELIEAGLDDVVLVTDPYHALRSKLIAGEVGLDASVAPVPDGVVEGGASLRRHLLEAGGVAVGRIIGFEQLSAVTG